MKRYIQIILLLNLLSACREHTEYQIGAVTTVSGELKSFQDIEFAWIPPGTFQMGSNAPDDSADQQPLRKVRITKGYWLSKCEITQKQWQEVMKDNPSRVKNESYPVTNVTWYQCLEFTERLSKMDRTGTYRLPTEAEWEYACKGGGDLRFPTDSNDTNLDDFAWHVKNSGGMLHAVGTKKPSVWGLHDMSGNAMEWCFDSYQGYSGAPTVDPVVGKPNLAGKVIMALVPETSSRVWRGGSFDWPDGCHCAYRSYGSPSKGEDFLGFRIVREP